MEGDADPEGSGSASNLRLRICLRRSSADDLAEERKAMAIWKIEADGAVDVVKRRGRIIATITDNSDGSLRWDGLGMYRIGFKKGSYAEILEDVKYFHRYHPPRLTIQLKSGRKIIYK